MPTDPASSPAPADVLRWCAAAAPALWFPSAHAAETGTPRDALDDPLWKLRQAGFVQVGDWVKGFGQGFAITPAGRDAIADPKKLALASDPPPPPPPGDVPPAIASVHTRTVPRSPSRGLTRYDRGEMAREAALGRKMAVVAPALLLLNLAWFGVGVVVAWKTGVSVNDYLQKSVPSVLLKTGAVDGMDIFRGQWWRLLSSCFVHIGLTHLLVNSLALGTIGPTVENFWGRWRFALIYLAGGLSGSCLAMALDPNSLTAGASGAIWGLMTATLVWTVRYRVFLPEELARVWVGRLLMILGVNAVVSLIPGISWQAHLGGGIGGALAALALDHARAGNGWRRWAGWAAVVAVMAAGPAGLVAAMRYSQAWKPFHAVADIQKQVDRIGRFAQAAVQSGGNQVAVVHKTVTLALISGSPEKIREAQDRVSQFRSAAETARELIPAGAPGLTRAYLEAATAFADEADGLLKAGRTPSPEGWKALADKKKAAEQAWAAISGQQSTSPNPE
jgi:rhomboid protease GluP